MVVAVTAVELEAPKEVGVMVEAPKEVGVMVEVEVMAAATAAAVEDNTWPPTSAPRRLKRPTDLYLGTLERIPMIPFQ